MPDGGTAFDPTSDAGGPPSIVSGSLSIVSLTSTGQRLTGGKPLTSETDSLTFVAIVTDPKGLDHIAGGQLVDDGGATYAAFGAGATKGTYAATLTFATMNQVRSADFPTVGGSRKFSAKFFDNDGKAAVASIEIALACRDETYGLIGSCGGVCTDRAANGSNCSQCGVSCGSGQRCSNGSCGSQTTGPDECLHAKWFGPNTTCAAICAARGRPCRYGQFVYYQPDCKSGFAGGCTGPVGDYFMCDCAP
jgi:hypothetical protein